MMTLRTGKLNTGAGSVVACLALVVGASTAFGCSGDDSADSEALGGAFGAPDGANEQGSGGVVIGSGASTGGAEPSDSDSGGASASGSSALGGSGATATTTGGAEQSSTGGTEATVPASGGSGPSAGGATEGGSGTSVPGETGGTTTGPTGGAEQGPTGGTEQGDGGGTQAGGSPAAGAAGEGGVVVPDPTPTSGCGAATWPENGRYSMEINGKTREYILTVPEGYDGTTPMKLISVWHGLGGTIDDMDNAFWGYYGMATANDGSAIFTAGQGLPSEASGTDFAWRNTDQEDTDFARAIFEWFGANFCIDAERIFATGMSYGGVMSNEVGCYVGDVVRAIGPIAGAGPGFGAWGGGGPQCVGQVASILVHGTADETVTLDNGEASRDHWLEANGCSTTTQPAEPTEYCVQYDGCQSDYPVVWCVHDGGHTIPDWSPQAIWDFFEQF